MPSGFNIGPIFVHFYGIILMSGAVAGAFLARREVKRRGLDPEIIWDMLVYLLIAGILGARLWHIFPYRQPRSREGLQLSIISPILWMLLLSGMAGWASQAR